uniref:DUF569 domain-containing protein n=1 Tax=Oryza rufipogon TaxID=4529 RepID=A0A0E0PU29_ORYRU
MIISVSSFMSKKMGFRLSENLTCILFAVAATGRVRIFFRSVLLAQEVWFAVRSGWGDDVLLRHYSWRFLRADDTGVIADRFDGRRIGEVAVGGGGWWRPSPRGTPYLGLRILRPHSVSLSVPSGSSDLHIMSWSALHLWNQLSSRMGFEPDPNSTMCVRAGTYGRLTPLVTDLPGNNSAMVIFVLPPESLAGFGLTCPNVHAA